MSSDHTRTVVAKNGCPSSRGLGQVGRHSVVDLPGPKSGHGEGLAGEQFNCCVIEQQMFGWHFVEFLVVSQASNEITTRH